MKIYNSLFLLLAMLISINPVWADVQPFYLNVEYDQNIPLNLKTKSYFLLDEGQPDTCKISIESTGNSLYESSQDTKTLVYFAVTDNMEISAIGYTVKSSRPTCVYSLSRLKLIIGNAEGKLAAFNVALSTTSDGDNYIEYDHGEKKHYTFEFSDPNETSIRINTNEKANIYLIPKSSL
jgi:hypothetical protein